MSTTTLYILSVAEAVVLVVVLALALIAIRRRLLDIAKGLGTLGDALTTVETEHLKPLRPAVEAINAQFEGIVGLMPGVARKAGIVAAHTGNGRREGKRAAKKKPAATKTKARSKK